MSEQPATPPGVPLWDTADRMRKALRQADVGVREIADYLGVSRNTVGTWINGHAEPSTRTLRLWALRTGVPYEWLTQGDDDTGAGPGIGRQSVPSSSVESLPVTAISHNVLRLVA